MSLVGRELEKIRRTIDDVLKNIDSDDVLNELSREQLIFKLQNTRYSLEAVLERL